MERVDLKTYKKKKGGFTVEHVIETKNRKWKRKMRDVREYQFVRNESKIGDDAANGVYDYDTRLRHAVKGWKVRGDVWYYVKRSTYGESTKTTRFYDEVKKNELVHELHYCRPCSHIVNLVLSKFVPKIPC